VSLTVTGVGGSAVAVSECIIAATRTIPQKIFKGNRRRIQCTCVEDEA